jgi:2'-5' RNA ligase
MRRGHRAPPRPALPRRAVIAIPSGESTAAIEAFRERHDPLVHSLPGHVTFVFPFASTLSALQVATHLRRVAGHWPAIPIRLHGIGVHRGEWVHLRVTRGAQAIVELHDRLYRRSLAPFLRDDLVYDPHVTIGRGRDAAEADAIAVEADAAFPRPLELVLRSLALVAVPRAGAAVRECEIGLG